MRYAALLRAVNLPSHQKVGMAALRICLEKAGLTDVRTLLQSGNAVFDAPGEPDTVARAIERAIAGRFGMEVGVVVRTAAEWADVVAADALGDVATGGAKQHVIFLSAPPDAAALAAIGDPAPEAFAVRGREIHVWCPDGLQGSALFKALSKPQIAPGAIATARNWNTVTKLAALAGEG